MAARVIAAIENPADVFAISARPFGQRAVLKFASHTGATPIASRFTPGAFTNQIQAAFREPRLLVIGDPRLDHQPIKEASYVNIPVIAFCNTDATLRHVDIAIPCNNNGAHSIGLMWWLLAREVLRLRGTISREHPWDIMVDLYFYRDPLEVEKEEQAAAAAALEAQQAPAQQGQETEIWGGDVGDWGTKPSSDWGAEITSQQPSGIGVVPAFGTAATATAPAADDWGASAESGQDWAAATEHTTDWASSTPSGQQEWA